MLSAIATAANGLAAQSRRIEAAAREIASIGAGAPAVDAQGSARTPVRIGALPSGDTVQSVVTLVEAEQAYLMNAAVIATAAGMLDTLLDAIGRRD